MMDKANVVQHKFRWWRVAMWAFLGFTYFVSVTDTFVFGEIGALLFGLVRFFGEVRHTKRNPNKLRRAYKEYQAVIFSFIGFAMGMATAEGLGTRIWGPVFAVVFIGAHYLWQHRPMAEEETTIERPMSPKMAAHYEQVGMSEAEVNVFRDTMASASKNVHQIETTVAGVVELQDILAENDTMNVIHAYFRALVDEPKRMTEAAPFLYEQLPNMADLARKYAVITHHEIKTADTYLVLTQAKDALTKLGTKIRKEYTDFVQSDLDNLDTSVQLAKQQTADETETDLPNEVEEDKQDER